MGIFFNKKTEKKTQIDLTRLPRHIGIIMDGNGRWAQQRGLPRTAGHAAGIKTFRKIASHAADIGIEQVTFYAFSTENWKRPQQEVNRIMELLEEYIDEALGGFEKEQVRVRFLGDVSPFRPQMVDKMKRLEMLTAKFDGKTLNIALNYGGRNEIAFAARQIAMKVRSGEIIPEEIDEKLVSEHLYFNDLSECDLIIRPSGEYRLSNFLLWQSAYSEYVFDEILWPDYKEKDLDKAIIDFQKRQRRFGAI